MGAVSEAVRRLVFGAFWSCAVLASCTGPAEGPSTTAGEARGKEPGTAQAGAGTEAGASAGAAGAPHEDGEPVFGMGAGTRDPNEGSGAAGTGGHPSSVRDPNGGEAAAGAESDPACGKQTDGTLCGQNMSPPGPEGARYFCSSGEIIAQAACPGPCDAETNACVQSGGTGGGMGETGFGTLLKCRTCYAVPCRVELMACDADPLCTAHRECYETCNQEHDCYAICDSVFEAEPLIDQLNACVDSTGCVDICPHD